MSIWCSTDHIGTDPTVMYEVGEGIYQVDIGAGVPKGRKVEQTAQHGNVLTFAEGFSNHFPDLTGTHERPAAIGLAYIAPWCTPGHGDCDTHDYPECGPWLRLEVGGRGLSFWTKDDDGNPTEENVSATVVLDEPAARELARQLLEWADRPHLISTT